MTITSGSRLLTPPPEREEKPPYRPVWRSMTIEGGIMVGITTMLFIGANVLSIRPPTSLDVYGGLFLALLPALLWLLFSWWPERRVPQPRQHLLTVAIISGLAANAIGIPLINDYLQVERWLPLSNAINRIIGYTFTTGIVQELLKYLVIRFTAWPLDYRIRMDAVAYGIASAVGYATVQNLHLIATTPSTPDVTVLRVFWNYSLHLAASFVVAYGLSEVRFSNPMPAFLMICYSLASFVTGLIIPIRAGLVNAQFSLKSTVPRSFLGLGFAVVVLVVPPLILSFLLSNAERRAREATVESEI
jgi:RsiW-degrading membrane proteinase PrsW (M82 family)